MLHGARWDSPGRRGSDATETYAGGEIVVSRGIGTLTPGPEQLHTPTFQVMGMQAICGGPDTSGKICSAKS